MDVRVLRYFLTVAREGTISRAAQTLHVTQPTLSRQLIDLEKELGAQLFIRGKRRMTLTDEGMLLRKRAEEITELVDKTENEFHHQKDIIAGTVSIGGGETYAMRTVARIATEIHRDYPEVEYNIFSGNADDVTDKLDKGLIDFGVLIEPADITKYESIRLPDVDVWGVLMRRDSPLASYERITPDQIRNLPLISSRQTMVGRGLAEWFGKNYEQLDIVASYNLIYNASLLVKEGLGYALSLDKLVNTNESELVFRPLEPRMIAHLDIVWKKYQVFPKAAELFLRKLSEYVENGHVDSSSDAT